jgi:hypothetical protein
VPSLAQSLASPAAIFAVVGLLVVWAGWSAARRHGRTQTLISTLSATCAIVDEPEFLSNLAAWAEQLAALPFRSHIRSAKHGKEIDHVAIHMP